MNAVITRKHKINSYTNVYIWEVPIKNHQKQRVHKRVGRFLPSVPFEVYTQPRGDPQSCKVQNMQLVVLLWQFSSLMWNIRNNFYEYESWFTCILKKDMIFNQSWTSEMAEFGRSTKKPSICVTSICEVLCIPRFKRNEIGIHLRGIKRL